jgi:hypothetical protein
MDYDFWLRAATQAFQFLYLEEKLATSRLHPSSKTVSRRFDIHREIFRVQKEVVGFVHPQWILSFTNYLTNGWNGLGRANQIIPSRAWLKLLTWNYNSIPKFKRIHLDKARRRFKDAARKVWNGNGYAGRGFDGCWVGPDLSLTYANPQRLDSIELAGRAFFPLVLAVYTDDKFLHTESVSAGDFVLRCNVGTQPVRKIRITANHYTMPFPPIVNSKISFRLNWCNFFDDLNFPIRIIG